jgi:hypothetical protein
MSRVRVLRAAAHALSVCAAALLLTFAGDFDGRAEEPSTPDPAAASAPAKLDNTVRAACDLAFAIAANTFGVTVRNQTGDFYDDALAAPVFGCMVSVTGSFAAVREEAGDAPSRLHFGFNARGWQELAAYAAAADTGRRFAFRKGEVTCLFAAVWEAKRRDRYDVAALCSRAIPDTPAR